MTCSATYTPVSISGYNADAPPDDGSAVAGNVITWAFHKEKLGDPLKTALEAMDANIQTFATAVSGCFAALAVAYAGPCFIAGKSSNQTGISDSTYTKVTWDEAYDSDDNFDSNRFTPTTAGRFLLTSVVDMDPSSYSGGKPFQLHVYKNGSSAFRLADHYWSTGGQTASVGGAAIVEANGTTDYFEIYLYHEAGTSVTAQGVSSGSERSFFSGARIQ